LYVCNRPYAGGAEQWRGGDADSAAQRLAAKIVPAAPSSGGVEWGGVRWGRSSGSLTF